MEFNSNLNNLFKNFQQLNSRNLSAQERAKLNKEKNELLKDKNLFDVNGDGKFNQEDIDMFVKGDVNGDEEITQEELNFVSSYKKDLKQAFMKEKADFELNGKIYVAGKEVSEPTTQVTAYTRPDKITPSEVEQSQIDGMKSKLDRMKAELVSLQQQKEEIETMLNKYTNKYIGDMTPSKLNNINSQIADLEKGIAMLSALITFREADNAISDSNEEDKAADISVPNVEEGERSSETEEENNESEIIVKPENYSNGIKPTKLEQKIKRQNVKNTNSFTSSNKPQEGTTNDKFNSISKRIGYKK